MNNEFDPYDLLMEVLERQHRLEQAHNKIAQALQDSERDLNVALKSLQHLQKTHMITISNQIKLEKQLEDLKQNKY